jgi:stage III sporulation protein SpoIIIAA
VYLVSFLTAGLQILVGSKTPGIWTSLLDDVAGSKWLLVIGNPGKGVFSL